MSSSSVSLPPISSPQYTVLSFDLYGTLIDWEGGIHPYLAPLTSHLPSSHPYLTPFTTSPTPGSNTLAAQHPLIAAFSAHEARIQDSNPTIPFEDVLRGAYEAIAQEVGAEVREKDVDALIKSSRSWPPFPDTVAAMNQLEKSGRLKFVALSNNSTAGLKAVLEGPSLGGVRFDRAFSAEEVGAYKPDRRGFEMVLRAVQEMGQEQGESWGKENLLHVAHGVGTDQTPCEEMGIRHVWVERGVDNWRDVDREKMHRLVTVRDAKDLAGLLLDDE